MARQLDSGRRQRPTALLRLARNAGFLGAAVALWSPALAASAQVRLQAETGGSYSVHVRSLRDIPFRTVVRQQYDYSCGSAAVATLLTYHYGVAAGESDIFTVMWQVGDRANITRVGFSMLDMKRYLAVKGLNSDGYRMTLDEIAAEKTPAIALLDLGAYRHFVVIKGVQGDQVLVGDPARGLKIYARKDFQKMWNGIVLMIHDSPKTPRFDEESEWRPWAPAPVRVMGGQTSLASLTSNLAPIYQITLGRSEPPLP